MLYRSQVINTLFYGLPNLAFLALLLSSVAVVWSGGLRRGPGTLLLINWLAVLLGNLVHPMFQRIAITFLAVSFLPLVSQLWQQREAHGE